MLILHKVKPLEIGRHVYFDNYYSSSEISGDMFIDKHMLEVLSVVIEKMYKKQL